MGAALSGGVGPTPPLIVLLAALEEEAAGLRRAMALAPAGSAGPHDALFTGCYQGRAVQLVRTGLGRQRAEEAAAAILGPGRAAAVLSIGFSGALEGRARAGDLVLASALLAISTLAGGEIEPAVYRPDPQLLRAATVALEATPLRLLLGPTVTAPGILAAPAEKQALGRQTGAVAVDMESYWVARAATERGLPFLSLRAVSDTQADRLPALPEFLRSDGSPAAGPLAAYLLRSPGSLAAFLRLARNAGRARRALTEAVACTVATL